MLDFAAIGAALVDARSAWLSEPAIAAALGVPDAELRVAVAGLVAGRLLERWDRPDGAVVTLTALGARQLGVRLVELADGELYRWSADAVSVRTRRVSRSARLRTEAHADLLEQRADRGYEHRTRTINRRAAERSDLRPPAILLLGEAIWPWDEHRTGPRPPTWCRACAPRMLRRHRVVAPSSCGPCGRRRPPRLDHCPACRGRKLSPSTYCLRCDRWGMDGYFGRRLGTKSRRPERKAG